MSRTPEQKARYAEKAKLRRASNPEKYRQIDKDRHNAARRKQKRESAERNQNAVKERNKLTYERDKEKIKAGVKSWRERHPERRKAHHQVERAIQQGILVRPNNCSNCSKECKPDAAHTDYNYPLNVIWLCRRCHMRMDKDPEGNIDVIVS